MPSVFRNRVRIRRSPRGAATAAGNAIPYWFCVYRILNFNQTVDLPIKKKKKNCFAQSGRRNNKRMKRTRNILIKISSSKSFYRNKLRDYMDRDWITYSSVREMVGTRGRCSTRCVYCYRMRVRCYTSCVKKITRVDSKQWIGFIHLEPLCEIFFHDV